MINNDLLEQVAKALNDESFNVPTHLAKGTTAVVVDGSETSLTGEIGTRASVTSSRTDYSTTYNALLSGVDVVDTANGDNLRSIALFDAISSGNVEAMVSLAGLLQTTNFDIDVDWQVTVSRA